MLAQQYRATTLELNQRREEQARDLRAHLLRANIEGAWMDLVAAFPGIEGGDLQECRRQLQSREGHRRAWR